MKRPATILLVEDNPMDIELTIDAFRESGSHDDLVVVETGEAAIAYVERTGVYADRKDTRLPDFILLDLKLPGIDGFAVARRLKQGESTRRIPIIVLTSSAEERDRALSYDLGVNSYIVKPMSYTSFVEIVRHIESYWREINTPPPEAYRG